MDIRGNIQRKNCIQICEKLSHIGMDTRSIIFRNFTKFGKIFTIMMANLLDFFKKYCSKRCNFTKFF